MEGQFNVTLSNIITKVEGQAIEIGEISISGRGSRTWLDILIGYRVFNRLPKIFKQLVDIANEIN